MDFGGPGPKDTSMRIDGDKKGRPTDEDFQNKIDGYLQTKEVTPHRYYEVVSELQDWSAGEGDQGLRDMYYQGWTDEDFQEVLRRLGEE